MESKMPEDYRNLLVWRKSMILVTEVYKATQLFPKEEAYGLTSQIRRSAISIPSNIAEGKGRFSPAEFRQFLIQARGSLLELETQLIISGNLGYLKGAKFEELKAKTIEVGKMLNGLIEAVRRQKKQLNADG
jgi:four helix bundle protein